MTHFGTTFNRPEFPDSGRLLTFVHRLAEDSLRQPQRTVPSERPGRILRVAAGIIIFIQVIALALHLCLSSGELAPLLWTFHSISILAGVGILAVTFVFEAAVDQNWEVFGLLMLAVSLGAMIPTAVAGDQILALIILLIIFTALAGSSLMPWGPRWQASFSGVSLSYFGIAVWLSHPTLSQFVFWCFGMAVAVALGQSSAIILARFRAAAMAQIAELEARDRRVLIEIAGREQARRRLEERAITLQRMMEYSLDAIGVSTLPDLHFIQATPSFERLFGYSQEELAGKHPAELKVGLDENVCNAFADRIMHYGSVSEAELRMTSKSGEPLTVLISATKAEMEGVPCVVWLMRDITRIVETEAKLRAEIAEREAMEHKLRESESALRQIIETSPDCIAITRLEDGFMKQVNAAFLQTMGYTAEELIGQSARTLGVWADPGQAAAFVQRLRAESVVRNMGVDLRRKDGTVVPHLISSALLRIGSEECAVTMTRDITEIKRTEEQLRAENAERQNIERKLREREVMLRSIIDTSPNCISLTRLSDGAHVLVNDAWVKQLGFSRDEAIGKTARELGIWTDINQVRMLMQQLGENSVVPNIELYLRHKQGALIPYVGSFGLTKIDSDQYVVTIGHDITEIKKTQNELVQAREAALAASKAKSEFLSGMSHEIRTPMNAVLGMADLLAESNLDSDQRRYLDVMVSNGNSLLELINSILDLAKIEAGRLQIEQIDLDLLDLIETAVVTFSQRAHAKGLEVTARIAPGVPHNLVGDPLRLRQVLINLLSNALKFTSTGEIRLVVQRNPDSDTHGDLLFTVEDTGIGIPADKLEAIFNSFTQVDSSTTRQYGGSGLGLTIVKRIIELMNGRIWVESTLGVGSKFSFTLPLGVAVKSRDAEPPALPDLTGRRVLVVDDIATNRMIIREIVASRGALVDEAECGADALNAVRRANSAGVPYQIILLDMRMPGMDGLETSRLIRAEQLSSEPLILMLSSDDLKPQLALLRESGLDRYLVKPITRRELFNAIAGLMKRAGDSTRSAGVSRSEILAPAEAPIASILIAEDAPDNRLLVTTYLKREPYKLDVAENGKIALEKFVAGHYDLVLMDLHMPLMDGYDATRAIRQFERERSLPRTPILALTASAFEEDAGQAFEAGCDEHMAKPVKKASLLQIVRKYTSRLESAPGKHASVG